MPPVEVPLAREQPVAEDSSCLLEHATLPKRSVPFDQHLLDKIDPTLIDRLRQQGFEVTGYRLEVLGHFQEKVAAP